MVDIFGAPPGVCCSLLLRLSANALTWGGWVGRRPQHQPRRGPPGAVQLRPGRRGQRAHRRGAGRLAAPRRRLLLVGARRPLLTGPCRFSWAPAALKPHADSGTIEPHCTNVPIRLADATRQRKVVVLRQTMRVGGPCFQIKQPRSAWSCESGGTPPHTLPCVRVVKITCISHVPHQTAS